MPCIPAFGTQKTGYHADMVIDFLAKGVIEVKNILKAIYFCQRMRFLIFFFGEPHRNRMRPPAEGGLVFLRGGV
jgi:hypothetical protein